jgi:hypothetical protein
VIPSGALGRWRATVVLLAGPGEVTQSLAAVERWIVESDYGRGEYLRLMVSRDRTIQRLVEDGYQFVTNAFRVGAAPKGVRAKDAEAVATRLRREGYRVELASAYNETGDPVASMVSVWRKRAAGREGGGAQ